MELRSFSIPCKQTLEFLSHLCDEMGLKINPAVEVPRSCRIKPVKRLSRRVMDKPKPGKKAQPINQEKNVYELEKVVNYAKDEVGADWYYVKWKGWSSQYNSWEPKENLISKCRNALRDYHRNHPEQVFPVDLKTQEPGPKKSRVCDPKSVPNKSKQMQLDSFLKSITNERADILMDLIKQVTENKHNGLLNEFMSRALVPPKNGYVTVPSIKIPQVLLDSLTQQWTSKFDEVQKQLKDWENSINLEAGNGAPIVIENEVDLEGPPENFTYINDYKAGEGIVIPDDPLVGCECIDCYENRNHCCPHNSGGEYPYTKHKKLRLPKGSPIYECNTRCKCPPDCPNRVVQHGCKIKLAIFRTSSGCGWGVKALESIKKDTFIMEYVGEVITSEEAEKRGQDYDAQGRTYLFDLDYNDDDCPFTVDAAFFGNVSHFMNHSCEPNLQVYGVWINTLDPRLPRIAFFSRRDIKKGEELTFDYMMSVGETAYQRSALKTSDEENLGESQGSASSVTKRMMCKCGTPSCRQYLF